MKQYEFFWKTIRIGTLTVDPDTNRHAYTVEEEGLSRVIGHVPLDRVMQEGTDGFVQPIPFFETRLYYMKRYGLHKLNYHTDYFVLREVCDEQRE